MASKLLNVKTIFSQVPSKNFLPQTLTSSKRNISEAVKKNQERFQIDDGVPVYIKGGFTDKILFMVTCVFCAIGFIESMRTVYTLAAGKKK